MNSMGVRAALAALLLVMATVKAEDGGVTFWRKDFTMKCPENGNWYYKDNKEVASKNETLQLPYENSNKGLYYCEYDSDSVKTKYHFYVQGKVCENCYELDASLFWLVIVADVLGTAFVMMIIYKCTKKKSSAGLTNASKAPARSGGRAPPVPSSVAQGAYEELSAHTRSKDTYSIVNRMG